MSLTVLVDVGSTYTKLVAVDVAAEAVLATAQAPTTAATDVGLGFEAALAALRAALGGEPGACARYLASSSAAGGLRMVAIGLVPALTTEAARRAALCAGAKLVRSFSHVLSRAETAELEALAPDIVLLVGGTDGGNTEVPVANARRLAGSAVDAPIVYAGNKSAADDVQAVLEAAGKAVVTSANVMPEIGQLCVEAARATIRDIFMRRIVEAKGIHRVRDRAGEILMPTPMAVLRAAELLAQGTPDEPGLGDLVVVDVGGATTDVHSVGHGRPRRADWIPKGLPEPYAKRTVEGDLGLRVNAGSILTTAGAERITAHLGGDPRDLAAATAYLAAHPESVPSSDADYEIDTALAAAAVDVAMERHAGRVEQLYTASGPATFLYGKDLSDVRHVVGVGGVFVRGRAPGRILRAVLGDPRDPTSTRPRQPALAVDRDYLAYAMGLLSTVAPTAALRILKAHLVPVAPG